MNIHTHAHALIQYIVNITIYWYKVSKNSYKHDYVNILMNTYDITRKSNLKRERELLGIKDFWENTTFIERKTLLKKKL